MPKTPINYANTIMYKLVCNDLEVKECYVGHTTNFIKRKQKHKTCCYNENGKAYNEKKYMVIRANGGLDNWTMVKIENHPCKDVDEAKKRERQLYEELNAQLNSVCPYRSKEEAKERFKNYSAEYRQTHKEELNEKSKKHYDEKKEYYRIKHSEYNKTHKEECAKRQATYRNKHPDKIQEYKEKNRERDNEKSKEYYERTKQMVCCELCGLELLKHSLNRHIRVKH